MSCVSWCVSPACGSAASRLIKQYADDECSVDLHQASLGFPWMQAKRRRTACPGESPVRQPRPTEGAVHANRSEEHTSELQSQSNLVCRLLLEKKKKKSSKSAATAGLTI